jgi:hypothetical protein
MATKYKYIRLEPADNGHKLCYTKCKEADDIKREYYSEGMPRELVFENNDKAVKAYLKLCEANGQGADVDEEIRAIKGVEIEEEEEY